MTDTRTLLAGMAMPACLAQVWAKTNKERIGFGPGSSSYVVAAVSAIEAADALMAELAATAPVVPAAPVAHETKADGDGWREFPAPPNARIAVAGWIDGKGEDDGCWWRGVDTTDANGAPTVNLCTLLWMPRIDMPTRSPVGLKTAAAIARAAIRKARGQG